MLDNGAADPSAEFAPVTTESSLREKRHLLAQTLIVGVFASGVLAAAQAAASLMTGSVGIRAAAIDRLIDLSVHVAALSGVWMATRPPDPRHPYGYERYETLTSMVIGVFLLATVALVVRSSIERLFDPRPVDLPFVGIAVMAWASAVSFWLTWFFRRMNRRFGSEVISAESSHAWADGLTGTAVLAGIVLSQWDLTRIDAVVGLAASALIGLRAVLIVKGAASLLTDAALVNVEEIVALAKLVPGVEDCHAVRSRGSAGRIRIDMHIHVEPDLPVRQAHRVATEVEAVIKERIAGVAEVLVHVGAAGGPT